MKRLERKSSAGFTLIEILLVIIIVISLMAVLLPNIRNALTDSKKGSAEIYVNKLAGDLALYEATNGRPPTTQQGLAALVQKPTSEPIPRKWSAREDKIELDPWGSLYFYDYPGKHNANSFDVYSAGPDGKPGTEDDIGNWTSN
ncbi:MAG: type II secretion system major pseudopilin GspG [Chthoniobacteraceae bacterium]